MTSYSAQYGKLLEGIAKEGDAIALKYFRADDLQIEKKRDGTRVTQADKEVEAMARARVKASGLELDVLGEEMGGSGANAPAGARARLIIDPIDGTVNFANGIPICCVSIGVEVDGKMTLGAVYNPFMNEFFIGEKGSGAIEQVHGVQYGNGAEQGFVGSGANSKVSGCGAE